MRPTVLAFLFLGLSIGTASAGVIVSASSISSPQTPFQASTIGLIDQTGLHSNYVSGVTDLTSYLASNPVTDNFATNVWGAFGTTAQFTLGTQGNAFDAFVLWNRGPTAQGVANFTLTASNDADFASFILLGNYTAAQGPGVSSATAQLFNFATTTNAFIRMDVTSIYGNCCVSLTQIAFGQTAEVPEPVTLAIFGTGVAGAVALRGRKKSKAT